MSGNRREFNDDLTLRSAQGPAGSNPVEEIKNISAIFELCALPYEKDLICFCLAKVRRVMSDLSWYVYTCPICNKKLTTDAMESPCCPSSNSRVEYRLELEAADMTGIIRLTLFNDKATKLIHQEASKVVEEHILAKGLDDTLGQGHFVPDVVREAFEGKEYIFKIKIDDFNHDVRWRQTFSVVDIVADHSVEINRMVDKVREKRARECSYGAMDRDSNSDGQLSKRIPTSPPSMTESFRSGHQNYHDAISIRFVGNPNWPEVNQTPEVATRLNRCRYQRVQNKESILRTVFRQKLQRLLEYIKEGRYFGCSVAGNVIFKVLFDVLNCIMSYD